MNAKISVFVICVEAIIYLLLCNLHDRTFNIDMSDSWKDTSNHLPNPLDVFDFKILLKNQNLL